MRIVRDSRRVAPGDAFIAMAEGTDRDTHLAEARARGAVRLLGEGGDAILVSHARWAFASMSAAAHGLPGRAPLFAVTGTKGKTTVTHLLQAALGAGAARIGTTGWHDGRTERGAAQTTPPPEELHAFLAALPADCPGIALEASSHGLDQHRLAGLRLAGLAYTGLGRDHLDYHGTGAAYLHAKLSATRLLAPGAPCIVAAEDRHAAIFAHAAHCAGAAVIALGPGPRLPGCAVAQVRRAASGWVLLAPGVELALPVPLPGAYNAWNAACAVLLAIGAGIAPELAARRLAAAPPVPGRMELLARSPDTYVDYAHTPESLTLAIAALRDVHPGRRLAVVFGCGGDRDPGKRAPMGTAATAADVVVLTDDNPRGEEPAAIVAQILSGLAGHAADVELDRGTAIRRARVLAGADGVVLVAGKGHETEQIRGGRAMPWDDRAFVAGLVGRAAGA